MKLLAMILDTAMYAISSILGQCCFMCALFGEKEKRKERLLYAIYFMVASIMFMIRMGD